MVIHVTACLSRSPCFVPSVNLSQFRACDLLIGLMLVPDIPELVGFRSVKSLYEATAAEHKPQWPCANSFEMDTSKWTMNQYDSSLQEYGRGSQRVTSAWVWRVALRMKARCSAGHVRTLSLWTPGNLTAKALLFILGPSPSNPLSD